MPGPAYLVEQSVSDEIPRHERADFWSEMVRSFHCRMDFRYSEPTRFSWKIERLRGPNHQLIRSASSDVRIRRTAQQIRQDPDDQYRFVLPDSGSIRIEQANQQATLGMGAGALFTVEAPMEYLIAPGNRHYILTVPRREIDHRIGSLDAAATVDLSQGLGKVVQESLITLFDERDRLTGRQFDATCDRMIELLCMLLTGDDRPPASGHLADVEAMVRRHIRDHAADPDLTGTSLARQIGWSLRQVQLALQQAGTTPRELIRDERLRLVRDRLGDPAYHHHSIGALAQMSGFSSINALGTAFRQRYGMSPREFRHQTTSRGG